MKWLADEEPQCLGMKVGVLIGLQRGMVLAKE